MDPKIVIFWASFGTDFGDQDAKMDPELDQKWNQIHVIILIRFFSFLEQEQFPNAKPKLSGPG